MNERELLQHVAEMRDAQRRYFNKKTRNKETLVESKRLEGLVDRGLAKLGISTELPARPGGR